jgi:hypothetical protein
MMRSVGWSGSGRELLRCIFLHLGEGGCGSDYLLDLRGCQHQLSAPTDSSGEQDISVGDESHGGLFAMRQNPR